MPTENEVLPDLKETIPHPEVTVSSKYQWQASIKNADVVLNKKYPNIPSSVSTQGVPYNKRLDVAEISRARKYAEELQYIASKRSDYRMTVNSGAEKLNLDQNTILQPATTSRVFDYHKPVEHSKVELTENSNLQPAYAGENILYEKPMDVLEYDLGHESHLQPANSAKEFVYGKRVSHKEIELENKSRLLPAKSSKELPYQTRVKNEEIELEKRTILQPANSARSLPYQKNVKTEDVRLERPNMNSSRLATKKYSL